MSPPMHSATGIVGYLALFGGVGFVFVFFNILLGKFLRPDSPNEEKLEIYECGEPAIGSSFVQFDLRFYVVALIFINRTLVLLQGSRKLVGAVAARHKVQRIGIGWIEHRVNCGFARHSNRRWGQPMARVGVVGRIIAQIAAPQIAVKLIPQTVDDGRVSL